MHPRWDGAHTIHAGTRGVAQGVSDPRYPASIAVRRGWPVGNPYTCARGLSLPQTEQRWSVVRNALNFTDVLQGDPAAEPYTLRSECNSHRWFEHMVRTHGQNPTASFDLCAMICDALRLSRRAARDFPGPEGWQGVVDSDHRLFDTLGIHPQGILSRFPSRCFYVETHVQERPVGIDDVRESHLTLCSPRVQRMPRKI